MSLHFTVIDEAEVHDIDWNLGVENQLQLIPDSFLLTAFHLHLFDALGWIQSEHVGILQINAGQAAGPGGLARIDLKDADVLGLDPAKGIEKVKVEGSKQEAVWNQLKLVFDPEIPVNVVDLGLIYDCEVKTQDSGTTSVLVKMTLTAPGCGMGPTIAADARSKILALEGIDEADVELVWDPAWNQSMISEAGKMKLGIL